MRQLKMLAAAIMAIAAITAITASTASAAAAGGFLPETTFTGSGGPGTLETLGGSQIKCKATNVLSGTMSTNSHGTVDIHYTGCSAFGIIAANSLGDAKEVILAPSLWLLCLATNNNAELKWDIWVEPSTAVHIETGGKLVKVIGGIIGTITPNASSIEKTIAFTAVKGDPGIKTCVGMDLATKTANQLTSEDDTTFQTSALSGSAIIKGAVASEIMDPK